MHQLNILVIFRNDIVLNVRPAFFTKKKVYLYIVYGFTYYNRETSTEMLPSHSSSTFCTQTDSHHFYKILGIAAFYHLINYVCNKAGHFELTCNFCWEVIFTRISTPVYQEYVVLSIINICCNIKRKIKKLVTIVK